MGEPPPEYCFLWINHWSTCMAKSEWAAWFQAFTAAAALYFAVRIATFQVRASAKQQRDAQVDKWTREIKLAGSILEFALTGIEIEISRLLALGPRDPVRGRPEAFVSLIPPIDTALGLGLPAGVSSCLVIARQTATHLHEARTRWEGFYPPAIKDFSSQIDMSMKVSAILRDKYKANLERAHEGGL